MESRIKSFCGLCDPRPGPGPRRDVTIFKECEAIIWAGDIFPLLRTRSGIVEHLGLLGYTARKVPHVAVECFGRLGFDYRRFDNILSLPYSVKWGRPCIEELMHARHVGWSWVLDELQKHRGFELRDQAGYTLIHELEEWKDTIESGAVPPLKVIDTRYLCTPEPDKLHIIKILIDDVRRRMRDCGVAELERPVDLTPLSRRANVNVYCKIRRHARGNTKLAIVALLSILRRTGLASRDMRALIGRAVYQTRGSVLWTIDSWRTHPRVWNGDRREHVMGRLRAEFDQSPSAGSASFDYYVRAVEYPDFDDVPQWAKYLWGC